MGSSLRLPNTGNQDVDVLYSNAKALGFDIDQEPKNWFYGQCRIFIVDSNGRLLRGAHHDRLPFMIKSFQHKGLRKLYETGSLAGVQASHGKRLRMQLAALDTAQTIEDMDIPGFRLHPLKGELQGRWSITVNANWRMTFEFKDGNAYVLDYEDYH